MKNMIRFSSVCMLMMLCNCHEDTVVLENANNTNDPITSSKTINDDTDDELIILYPAGTTEYEKQLKRMEYEVSDYKQCKCADENLELWIFNENSNDINIEERKQTAKVDEEIEGVNNNTIISIPNAQFAYNFNSFGIVDDALDRVVSQNQNITIAVLDTGINYYYPSFSNSFLYNASNNACVDNNSNEQFGWNFVNNNNNPFDDHSSLHGTVVSHMITSNLDANTVPYQLLPVKIADAYGGINYFDALCGFQYAANKENIKIINMSFGWYGEGYEILKTFIDRVDDEILVVCSAGNSSNDNDLWPHYPSSFDSDNIFSIAGLSRDFNRGNTIIDPTDMGLSSFSNFGIESVDIAAISENIPFMYNGQIYYYEGTSFSAAYATFFSALHYQNGMTVQNLKDEVIASSIYLPSLFKIKFSSHIQY